MSDSLGDVINSFNNISLEDQHRQLQCPAKIEMNKDFVRECVNAFVPEDWTYTSYHDKPYKLEELYHRSTEYRAIEDQMEESFGKPVEIYEIESVQNPFIYAQYQLKLKQKRNIHGNVTEHTLYHGTKEENINSICSTNFDWRRMGCSGYRYSKYGCGVSFSPSPLYASAYPRRWNDPKRVMFVVKVLEVSRCEGEDSLVIPPEPDDVSVSYDDNVFVKFFDNEFYPEYIIRYSD